MRTLVIALWLAVSITTPAFAYIGPGLGAGALAMILGIVGAVALALLSIVYYPIKRLMKGRRKPSSPSAGPPD